MSNQTGARIAATTKEVDYSRLGKLRPRLFGFASNDCPGVEDNRLRIDDFTVSIDSDEITGDRFSIWSLKAGGRHVWFDKPLNLDAFCYLSAQPNCLEIREYPTDPACSGQMNIPTVFSIGVRDILGKECLFSVYRSIDLATSACGEQRPANWSAIQTWSRKNNKRCSFVTDAQLAEHDLLITNWKRMMRRVRTAELNSDDDLRSEILALAARPEGLSIDEIASFISDVRADDVIAQVYWLIHQGTLDADIHNRRICKSSNVRRTTVH